MTDDSITARVLAIVARVAGPHRSPPAPGLDTPLAEGGFWLDSAGMLEVVVACETEFAVSFDPETDLTMERLATLGSLSSMVRGLREGFR